MLFVVVTMFSEVVDVEPSDASCSAGESAMDSFRYLIQE